MTSNNNITKQRSLGLVLSGGGARGLAHVGVLKALTEQGIDISCISGCSMGGLVGSLFALGYSIEKIEEIAKKHTTTREMINIVDHSPKRRGLIVGHRLRNLIASIIGKNTTFNDTKIPLVLNAVDLITSQQVKLSKGNLLDAIMATIAVPGFFEPVTIEKMQLIDGGTLDNLPVANIQDFNPDVTIAVNVQPDVKNEVPWQISGQKPRFILPLPDFFLDFYRAQLIMISKLTELNLDKCHPTLEIDPLLPPEITMFYGYHHASKIIKLGEESVLNHLDHIKQILYS